MQESMLRRSAFILWIVRLQRKGYDRHRLCVNRTASGKISLRRRIPHYRGNIFLQLLIFACLAHQHRTIIRNFKSFLGDADHGEARHMDLMLRRIKLNGFISWQCVF